MNRLLQNLNAEQYEAVSTTNGPLLVIAGAGSGKTRVLTRRVAYILTEQLAKPYQLLAVTFTNKAAGEMRERVASLLGGDIPSLSVSTFHSFCARFLRSEASVLGYEQSFTIFDAADSETLVKNCIKDLNLSTSQFTPKAQLGKISSAKNRMISVDQFDGAAAGYFEQSTAKIYRLYQTRIRQCSAMDFDDLLFNSVILLRDHEEIGEKYRQRFKFIMVDEYQDTNHVQYLLLKHLVGEHKNLCVVGDEDQSIYGWRGADIENILNFERDYPGAKVIKLEQNYRSTEIILKAASAVIDNNAARKGKTLRSTRDGGELIKLLLVDSADQEARGVIDRVNEDRSHTPLSETVVLYRTNAQSRTFEEQMRMHSIPYQIIGGISFYQRKEIKDLMAYLKLIANTRDDVSFQRVVNYPKRGIGNKSLSDIATLASSEGRSMYEIAVSADERNQLGRSAKRLLPFVELVERFRVKAETTPIDLLAQELVDDLALIEALRSEDEITGQTRIENVEALIEGMAEYARRNADANLVQYLADISLFTNIDNYDANDAKVTLMTLHSAKGLEFDTVFIAGLEEGLFPMNNAISEPMKLEEERRLFYVGTTRARKRLYLSSATTRFRFGEVESIPSRFLKEIPDELVERIDLRTRRHYEYGTRFTKPSLTGSVQKKEAVVQPTGVHYDFEDSEIMRVGRIIAHPTFGRGKIVAVDGFGESLRLDIMFTGVGMKKIMAKYARLKVVG